MNLRWSRLIIPLEERMVTAGTVSVGLVLSPRGQASLAVYGSIQLIHIVGILEILACLVCYSLPSLNRGNYTLYRSRIYFRTVYLDDYVYLTLIVLCTYTLGNKRSLKHYCELFLHLSQYSSSSSNMTSMSGRFCGSCLTGPQSLLGWRVSWPWLPHRDSYAACCMRPCIEWVSRPYGLDWFGWKCHLSLCVVIAVFRQGFRCRG